MCLITSSLIAMRERERERESIEICETGINISYSKHLLCRSVLVITAKWSQLRTQERWPNGIAISNYENYINHCNSNNINWPFQIVCRGL